MLAFAVLTQRDPHAACLDGRGNLGGSAPLACEPGHVKPAAKWHTRLGRRAGVRPRGERWRPEPPAAERLAIAQPPRRARQAW
jgi:hypothetical protein